MATPARAAREASGRGSEPGRLPACPEPVVVVGLGETGLSCVRHLRAHGRLPEVVDSREHPPGLETLRREHPEVPVHLGGFEAPALARAGTVVLSPGVSVREPAVARARERGAVLHGDIGLFAAAAAAPIAAVTGSNGKSTVTALLAEMARAAGRRVAAGGNLGPPALDLLHGAVPDLYVLELSSFQLETARGLRPVAAAVLNVSPDHLDRHPSLREYAAIKARVLEGASSAVVNRDDPTVAAMAPAARRVIGFTLGEPAGEDYGLRESAGARWLARGHLLMVRADALRLRGRHNLANALAALALAEACGLARPASIAALAGFAGLPHRCEPLGEIDRVRWYNDSKGTNVGATVAAIEGLGAEARLVLVAGGLGKGADFAPLAAACRRHARAVVLIGADAPRIEAAIGAAVPVERAASLDEAVGAARALARPGDAVLFSPACASFDMFESYAARGEAFRRAVGALRR